VVAIWPTQPFSLSSRVWKGRKLLEGTYLDPDELPRPERFAQGIVHSSHLAELTDPSSQTYASQPGPHQERAKEIYKDLRRNVVDIVVKVCRAHKVSMHWLIQTLKEYERTGYVWEQYNPLTGQGQRRYVPAVRPS
jgi:Glycosyl hydrolase family 63 C-terminal domain